MIVSVLSAVPVLVFRLRIHLAINSNSECQLVPLFDLDAAESVVNAVAAAEFVVDANFAVAELEEVDDAMVETTKEAVRT